MVVDGWWVRLVVGYCWVGEIEIGDRGFTTPGWAPQGGHPRAGWVPRLAAKSRLLSSIRARDYLSGASLDIDSQNPTQPTLTPLQPTTVSRLISSGNKRGGGASSSSSAGSGAGSGGGGGGGGKAVETSSAAAACARAAAACSAGQGRNGSFSLYSGTGRSASTAPRKYTKGV